MALIRNSRSIRLLLRAALFISIGSLYVLLFFLNWRSPIEGQEQVVFFWISSFQALLYLLIAVVVWWFACARVVAWFYLAFSMCVAFTFLVQTAAVSGEKWAQLLSSCLSVCAVLFLTWILLWFPKNYWTVSRKVPQLMLQGYFLLTGIWALLAFCVPWFYYYFTFPAQLLQSFWFFYYAYFLVIVGASCFFLVGTYRSATLRARQQQRIFIFGALLSLLPFICFTLLPIAFPWTAVGTVDGRWSTIWFVLFPLSLGYSILRYQLLLADRYIRSLAQTLLRILLIAMLVSGTAFLIQTGRIDGLVLIGSCAFFSLLIWKAAPYITDKLFFPEFLAFRNLLQTKGPLPQEHSTLAQLAGLLLLQCTNSFQTSNVCIFVWHDMHQRFHLLNPNVIQQDEEWGKSSPLIESLQSFGKKMERLLAISVWGIASSSVFLEYLHQEKGPCLFSWQEVGGRAEAIEPVPGTAQMRTMKKEAALSIPLYSSGLLAFLIIGESPLNPLSGSDIERAILLANHYSSMFKIAHLNTLYQQQQKLFLDLLVSSLLLPSPSTVEAKARHQAQISAEALGATVDIWLCDEWREPHPSKSSTSGLTWLSYIGTAGDGERLLGRERIALRAGDWEPVFYSYDLDQDKALNGATSLPSVFSTPPKKAFAWLPLHLPNAVLGLLIITYAGPHYFERLSGLSENAQEETILQFFAAATAAALIDVEKTERLELLYLERKREDERQEQFLRKATLELSSRLPLVTSALSTLRRGAAHEEMLPLLKKVQQVTDDLSQAVDELTKPRN